MTKICANFGKHFSLNPILWGWSTLVLIASILYGKNVWSFFLLAIVVKIAYCPITFFFFILKVSVHFDFPIVLFCAFFVVNVFCKQHFKVSYIFWLCVLFHLSVNECMTYFSLILYDLFQFLLLRWVLLISNPLYAQSEDWCLCPRFCRILQTMLNLVKNNTCFLLMTSFEQILNWEEGLCINPFLKY